MCRRARRRGYWAAGGPDVVPHSPQSLVSSSRGTTSLGSSGPTANRTWCFAPRNPLFLRPGAPRPRGPAGRRQVRRGASLPAIPYSFVNGHHVFTARRTFHIGPASLPARAAMPSPSISSQKSQKEAAPAAPLPTSSPIRRKSPAGDFRLLFSTKTHRHPGGVFRQKFPFLFLQGNFRHVFPEGLPANTPNGTPERLPISPSLPTSFPSAGRFLPCRRCWRKPSRSRFCPGSGQPSSSPARNPHRPCQNPFSPPG